jgi:site-specific DNA recombinase
MHSSPMSQNDARAPLKAIRAAVYCRVSTDESLHLEFNSLDAQREACEAYIKSQQHEGWLATSGRYEDGGFSGGTLERPGLTMLLAEVAAGRVDVIVVYKIDRLTRSLADFAKIVDVLDASKASFVSVTQAFNTTTSMGRLTLNVLLSFAQFEREVGAERVRDKIAASKKKGMWMGGVSPLGYDPKDRKLVVNEPEAETVRAIFQRYLQLGSVLLLEADLNCRGIRSKLRVSANGISSGGQRFTRGALYSMLQNRMYIGLTCHRGAAYPGQHDPIVDEDLFAQAQALLARNRNERELRSGAGGLALLSGLVRDAHGRRMSPSHSKKGPARYRYYSTKPDSNAPPGTRVAAAELDTVVKERITQFLDDRRALHDAIEAWDPDAVMLDAVLFAASRCQQQLLSGTSQAIRELLLKLVARVDVLAEEVRISVKRQRLIDLADLEIPWPAAASHLEIIIPVRVFRRAREVRLAIAPGTAAGTPTRDPALIKLVAKAWAARQALMNAGGASLEQVARECGVEPGYFTVLIKLGFLAPSIVSDILSGRQPATLDRQRLARIRKMPMDWNEQVRTLTW